MIVPRERLIDAMTTRGCAVLPAEHPLFVVLRCNRPVNAKRWKPEHAQEEWEQGIANPATPTMLTLLPYPVLGIGEGRWIHDWRDLGTLLEKDETGADRWRWLYLRGANVASTRLGMVKSVLRGKEYFEIGPVFAPTSEFFAKWSIYFDGMRRDQYARAWLEIAVQAGYLYESLCPDVGLDALLRVCQQYHTGKPVSGECLRLIAEAERMIVPEGLHPHIGYYLGTFATWARTWYELEAASGLIAQDLHTMLQRKSI